MSIQRLLLLSRWVATMQACKSEEFTHHRDKSYAQNCIALCIRVAFVFRKGGVRHVEYTILNNAQLPFLMGGVHFHPELKSLWGEREIF